MRVAWLADEHDPPGGAELTQAEFRAAAAKDAKVIDCPPDELERARDCDVACVFNTVTYPRETVGALDGKRVVRYWNDLAPHGDPGLKAWLCERATNVFCSPLHRERFPFEHENGELVPPPVNLARFRAAQNGHDRKGTVCVGSWMNFGKAPHLAAEWGAQNGGVDFYGGGPLAPEGSTAVEYDDLPSVLARYRTFVFLPTAVEPFGRAVVEAWAAGCDVIVNSLVGARHWIENEPEKLETAAQDFWRLVCE